MNMSSKRTCIIYILCIGCSSEVKLGTLTPHFKNGPLSFDIDHGGTKGYLNLVISDVSNSEVIWDINLNYYMGKSLSYGEIPKEFKTSNGVTNSALQNVPKNSMPPSKLIDGHTYKAISTWQYDQLSTAMAEHNILFFKVDGKQIKIMQSKK